MKKKRRRKLRPDRILLLAAGVCVVIGVPFFLLKGCSIKNTDEPAATAEASASAAAETGRVSLFLCGDSVIHESVYTDAENADGSFDFGKQLDAVADLAEPYDLEYYNQETILGGSALGLSGYPAFNSPQEFGSYMVSRGFNLVSTASNHSLDKGLPGIQASRTFWNSQQGVLTDGSNSSQEEYDAIPHTVVNGISIAFLAYTFGTNGIEPDYSWEVNCYTGHVDEMLAEVSSADEQYDCVIVAMHWGTEYSSEVNQEQLDLSQRLADAGADIIVGNHPHAVQPFKMINGTVPCFYAMGNLISSQPDTENRIGMIAGLDITKTDTGIKADNIRADLIYTLMQGEYPALRTDIRTVPFSSLSDDDLPDHEAIYSRYSSLITSLDSSITMGGV